MSILHLELTAKRAKDVASLLSQDTPRQIMDAISEEALPEGELAKKLNLPLSTVHYNMQRLLDVGLVASDEYTYSEKGKKIRHYKLTSEHVVITTKPLLTLPSIAGGLLVTVCTALAFALNRGPKELESSTAMMRADTMAMDAAPEAMMMTAKAMSYPLIWPWILAGAGAMLLGILVVFIVQRYRA